MSEFYQFLQPFLLLAQEVQEQPEAEQPGLLEIMWFPLLITIALYYFLVVLPQNRGGKRSDDLGKLKKNDQVVTVGGIFGTVSGFSADGDHVTLRIDDNTNTRIRVRKTSIEGVVKSDDDEKKTDDKSSS